MAQTQVWTLNDATEHVLDSHGVERTEGANLRDAVRAVLAAYRAVTTAYDWSLYRTRYILATVAPQSSSTITYDHTGGAYERVLTIAAGTWPTWAAFGKIIIDNVHYDVEDYKSSTEITLTAQSNPGADVAALTTYNLYRESYPLPVNFRRLASIIDADNQCQLQLTSDERQQYATQTCYQTPATPVLGTIRGDNEYFGSMALILSPPPDEIRYYDILYHRSPRDLNIELYNTGTVSSSSTAITGGSTVFPLDCVGSIIRFSATITAPTSIVGFAGGTTPVNNRYQDQRTITARASATAITVDSGLSAEVAAKAYSISDPLDIEYHSMFGALMARAEAELHRFRNKPGWQDRMAYADRQLRLAVEADQRAPNAESRVNYDPFSRATVQDDA